MSRGRDQLAPQSGSVRGAEERFRLLVTSVKDYAIFTLDPQGHVETWNPGAEAIKGYSAEEIVGRHISVFYTPEDVAAGRPEKLLRKAAIDGRVEDEGWRVRKGGTRFWTDVVITAMREPDGTISGYAKVTRDLTERRKAEAERLRLAQVEEAVRLRDEFLSIASHELRTPLSALQLQLESVLKGEPPLDERQRRKVERAFKGASRLADLVDTLLDVSRIATGRLSLIPTSTDLAVVVEEVAERFREQAARDQTPLVLHLEPGVVGEWDRLRIEQVVTNLLSNAFKYAAGTEVEVTVRSAGNTAELIVSDRGPGIPPSEWDRIFGRFERAASMRHFGGLGLGLYVARQIAEAHHGEISVDAVEPSGARFSVKLPRRMEERP